MAENDDAVLTAAVGYVYTGAVGTAAPTPASLKSLNLANPLGWSAAGWATVGHTSRGTLPEFGFEGGDSEIKGSWQKKKLREITPEDPIDYLTVVLHQFDQDSLGLYYGANASATPGVFGVRSGTPTNEKAGLVIIEDGDLRLGFHFHKSSVKRDDAIELPIDDLAALPIRFTFLDHNTELLFSWINEDLFNTAVAKIYKVKPNGATGGTYTLKVGSKTTASLAFNATAAAIKTALGDVDDGLAETLFTVVANGSDFDVTSPLPITLGTSSTTGGTGVTVV